MTTRVLTTHDRPIQRTSLEELVGRLIDAIFREEPDAPPQTVARAGQDARRLRQASRRSRRIGQTKAVRVFFMTYCNTHFRRTPSSWWRRSCRTLWRWRSSCPRTGWWPTAVEAPQVSVRAEGLEA